MEAPYRRYAPSPLHSRTRPSCDGVARSRGARLGGLRRKHGRLVRLEELRIDEVVEQVTTMKRHDYGPRVCVPMNVINRPTTTILFFEWYYAVGA